MGWFIRGTCVTKQSVINAKVLKAHVDCTSIRWEENITVYTIGPHLFLNRNFAHRGNKRTNVFTSEIHKIGLNCGKAGVLKNWPTCLPSYMYRYMCNVC